MSFGSRVFALLPKLDVEGSNPFSRSLSKPLLNLSLRYLPTVGNAARKSDEKG